MEKKEILTAVIVAIAVIVVTALLFWPTNKGPAKNYDKFAQCLSEKGAVEYGAYWCGHCKEQKEMFGDSFKFINYVECDAGGKNARPELCEQAGITGYPTWIINGKRLSGLQKFETLAAETNCTLPK